MDHDWSCRICTYCAVPSLSKTCHGPACLLGSHLLRRPSVWVLFFDLVFCVLWSVPRFLFAWKLLEVRLFVVLWVHSQMVWGVPALYHSAIGSASVKFAGNLIVGLQQWPSMLHHRVKFSLFFFLFFFLFSAIFFNRLVASCLLVHSHLSCHLVLA